MAKKIADTTTFQKLEKDAYHAFIEWPMFLVRKIKQLRKTCPPPRKKVRNDERKTVANL